jgi:hypothetical protein
MVTRTGDNLSITRRWCLVRVTASLAAITMYGSGCRASTRLVRVVVRGTVSLLMNWLGRWLRSWLLVVLASHALSLYLASVMYKDIACHTSTLTVLWNGLVVVALLRELGDDVPRVDKPGNVTEHAEKNVDETVCRAYSALYPDYAEDVVSRRSERCEPRN